MPSPFFEIGPNQPGDRPLILGRAVGLDEQPVGPGEWRFRLRPRHELLDTVALIVIDECSMVGDRSALDLMSFGIPILALGDPAQLPPVGDAISCSTASPTSCSQKYIGRPQTIQSLSYQIAFGAASPCRFPGTAQVVCADHQWSRC